jgi:DNA-binding transcriptional regulator YiaG
MTNINFDTPCVLAAYFGLCDSGQSIQLIRKAFRQYGVHDAVVHGQPLTDPAGHFRLMAAIRLGEMIALRAQDYERIAPIPRKAPCCSKPSEVPIYAAERIKALRQKLGWSQAKLADHLGVSQPTVFRFESGDPIPGPASRLLEMLEHSNSASHEAAE